MKIEKIRHSLAHIMAYAAQELFGDVKFGIGPVIENGFYYDIDFQGGKNPAPSDLKKIEQKMKELISKDIQFKKRMISKTEARKLFKNQPYKLELIDEIPESRLGLYESGGFVDLCRGPHVESTKEINPDGFKLTKIAGAYWRGSEKNKMLTRIYGAAFNSRKELGEYLKTQEEAEKNNHRILGEKMDLFITDKEVGKGLPLWLPKGYFIRRLLEDYIYRLEIEAGFLHVLTPHLAKEDLYKKSGHLAHYKDDMYAPLEIDKEKYYLKPMNCPHHHPIYKHKVRSYRDLPLRIAEFGTVYRYERSGVLSGLVRTRGFTQNDAHIYAAPEDLEKEIGDVLKMVKKVYGDFGIKDYWFRVSLPDFKNKEKYGDIANKKMWGEGAALLKKSLRKLNLKFSQAAGEATFYGPKIDIQTNDIYGKEDTIATIQVDYYSSSRFNLYYIGKDGREKPVVIIHRAVFGSFERFFSLLLEKTAGNLPLWLSPVQVWVMPVSAKQEKYAGQIDKKLKEEGIRSELKSAPDTLSKRIRNGEIQKIPYLLIVGDNEKKARSASVRKRQKGNIGMMKIEEFAAKIKKEADQKK